MNVSVNVVSVLSFRDMCSWTVCKKMFHIAALQSSSTLYRYRRMLAQIHSRLSLQVNSYNSCDFKSSCVQIRETPK